MPRFIASWCQSLLNVCARLNWLAPLIVRLFFGYFWAETGWAKLHNLDGAIEHFVGWGIPFPAFSATFSASAEFLGGVFLMLGLLTRITSFALIINMIVAIAFVAIKNVGGFDDFIELDEFVYMLIFFWLLIAGPGPVSVDTRINKWLGIRCPRPA
ncbi:MAG: DoxX family protein [Rudaea sp.]